MNEPQIPQTFDHRCLVEIMGHVKIAGRVTERSLFGTNMCQVDVPATSNNPAFTRLFGGGSIYSVNPVTEELARALAESLDVKPITVYEVREYLEKQEEKSRLKLKAAPTSEEEFPFDDEKDRDSDHSDDIDDLP